MLFTLLMVLYVVLAVFMIGFILIQRGAGAAAGSGFGAGASATVFGARGASSFLTKATKWLAIAFFLLTLGMAIYVQRTGLAGLSGPADDLGVMSGVAAPSGSDVPGAVPVDGMMSGAGDEVRGDVPAAPISDDQAGDVPVVDAAPAEPESEPEPEREQND